MLQIESLYFGRQLPFILFMGGQILSHTTRHLKSCIQKHKFNIILLYYLDLKKGNHFKFDVSVICFIFY